MHLCLCLDGDIIQAHFTTPGNFAFVTQHAKCSQIQCKFSEVYLRVFPFCHPFHISGQKMFCSKLIWKKSRGLLGFVSITDHFDAIYWQHLILRFYLGIVNKIDEAGINYSLRIYTQQQATMREARH